MNKSVGINQAGFAENSYLSSVLKSESNQPTESLSISRPTSVSSNQRKFIKNSIHSLSIKNVFPLEVYQSSKQLNKKVLFDRERDNQSMLRTNRKCLPSQGETKKKFRALNVEKYKKSQRIIQKRVLKEEEIRKLSKKRSQKSLNEVYDHRTPKTLKNGAIIKIDQSRKSRNESQELQMSREKLIINNISNIMNDRIQEIRDKLQMSKEIDNRISFEFKKLI